MAAVIICNDFGAQENKVSMFPLFPRQMLYVFYVSSNEMWTSLVAQLVKNLPAMQETWVRSMGWEDLPEEEMATHSSTLAGESLGQRSLVGFSPWGRKESGMIERLIIVHLKYWDILTTNI